MLGRYAAATALRNNGNLLNKVGCGKRRLVVHEYFQTACRNRPCGFFSPCLGAKHFHGQTDDEQAEQAFQTGIALLENPARQTKAIKQLTIASNLGHHLAQGALGQVLLEKASQQGETDPSQIISGQLPDGYTSSKEILSSIEKHVPILDSHGKPAGGQRSARGIQMEITRVRNANRAAKRAKRTGEDKKSDAVSGLEWLLSAAQGGHADSMVILGNAWFEDRALRKDLSSNALGITWEQALGLYERAANGEPPHPDALFNLAMLYMRGARDPDSNVEWVKRDERMAVELMHQAAAKCQDAAAMFWLGKHYLENASPSDTIEPSDQDMGLGFLVDASQRGHPGAQVYLASFLVDHFGDDPEMIAEAKRLLDLAVEQEDGQALAMCGDLHMQEGGSFYGNQGTDLTTALRFYERAGVAGHAGALCNVGAMHASGMGTPASDLEAYRAYEQAAKLGSLDAYRNIAAMHMEGRGPLEQNTQAAKEILRALKAVENS